MKKPRRAKRTTTAIAHSSDPYADLASDLAALLEEAHRQAARSVNAIMTATYWEIGRRIVKFQQGGKNKAGYGEELIDQLSIDLTARLGRGFGRRNLFQMRAFYLANPEIVQTVSAQFSQATESRKMRMPRKPLPAPIHQPSPAGSISEYLSTLAQAFPLPWSHYVRLLSVKTPEARAFYEIEARRGGWSVRQLDRQISTLFYERTALSKNKVGRPRPRAAVMGRHLGGISINFASILSL